MNIEYETIRSQRKSASLEIKNGKIIARVPLYASDEEVESFVQKHGKWLEKHLERSEQQTPSDTFTPESIKALAEKASEIIPERVRFFAPQIGVTYNRITIRSQRSRWGSCSSKGNLSFNCLLMAAPPEVLDSVVVHELCHLKEPNHSKRFYALVYRAFPDYDRCSRWLKEHGAELINRLP